MAVAVFFVLSGFVIRYVTLSRESTAKQYFIDRASRIYSVVVPALGITIACEWFAIHSVPWRSLPIQLAANLTFQAQNWGYEINPLHNDAFWSLSFECVYYVVYGLVFYRIRYRWLACFLLLLVAGPSITLMFPVWLLGCLALDTHQRLRGFRYAPSLFLVAVLSVLFAARSSVRHLATLTDQAHRASWVHQLPWLSRASASFVLVGLIASVFIVSSLSLLDGLRIPSLIATWIRVSADGTFSLYLLHLPLLILVAFKMGPTKSLPGASVVMSAITVTCIALAVPLDALKRYLRSHMERIWR